MDLDFEVLRFCFFLELRAQLLWMAYTPAQRRKGKKELLLDLDGSLRVSWKQILNHLTQRERSLAADPRSSAVSTQLSHVPVLEFVLDS